MTDSMIFCPVCGSDAADTFPMKDGTPMYVHVGNPLSVCIDEAGPDHIADEELVFATLNARGWHTCDCPKAKN